MISKYLQYSFILLLSAAWHGCGDTPASDPSSDIDEYSLSAGFVSLPSRYVAVDGFGLHAEGFTADAHIFYSFVPAAEAPEDAPVFLIFNGGPGAATSSALAAWGTGPFAMTEDGNVQVNPGDFSSLGNLVYLDTRQAGFSFDEIDDAASEAARLETFSFLNFNLHTDAADILFSFLKVLEDRPLIRDNPVIIVAESYGGARSAVLLSMVRNAAFGNPLSPFFQDESLTAALNRHFKDIGVTGPEKAVSQFGAQILIQPGRVLPMRVEAAHTIYSLCDHISEDDSRMIYCDGRTFDYADIREPAGFFEFRNQLAQSVLMTDTGFEQFFGTSWPAVDAFDPALRKRAFRFALPTEADLDASFDTTDPLTHWDAHHITMHLTPYFVWQDTGPYESYDAGDWAAKAFVESLRTVNTFITDAYFDFAVDSGKLGDALLEWNALQANSVISAAEHRIDVNVDVVRPGWLSVVFETGETRLIRMPKYKASGHMVPMYEPVEFLDDVRAFLADTEL